MCCVTAQSRLAGAPPITLGKRRRKRFCSDLPHLRLLLCLLLLSLLVNRSDIVLEDGSVRIFFIHIRPPSSACCHVCTPRTVCRRLAILPGASPSQGITQLSFSLILSLSRSLSPSLSPSLPPSLSLSLSPPLSNTSCPAMRARSGPAGPAVLGTLMGPRREDGPASSSVHCGSFE